eukprot:TRINITY_DN1728_c0_g1_i1.p1 TRINITY_DN1728_c0_g1~~TRINITY_DN1728_c0_g1_i1.p1  ORF type:complete len:394 (+),score=43.46 TRINITY_DN1728_c0_g1_i1:245-1426(+)
MAAGSPSQSSGGKGSPASNPSSSVSPSTTTENILYVCFNQDAKCFACGTEEGFQVYSCEPFKQVFRRKVDNGGIGIVEMLFQSNIMALVGGGPNPVYPPNKLMIWDDHHCRCIGDLSFKTEVRAVRLRRDRIVVVLDHKIYVYNFADLKLLQQIDTIENPNGLCAVSHDASNFVLVCPGLHRGHVRVELYAKKRTRFISAHDSRIACLALTLDGTLLATASSKGTLIRIFNTSDCTQLKELRRGADRAEIHSLAFSQNLQWLAVSSDKGTIHVFRLNVSRSGEEATTLDRFEGPDSTNASALSAVSSPWTNSTSLSFIKGVLPKYFNSQWSSAQFHVPEGMQYLVAFGNENNTVLIVGLDGSFYKCAFDPVRGGEMEQKEFEKFLSHTASGSL